MRIFRIVVILLLCSTSVWAQKCRLKVDSTDPISGEVVREAKIYIDQFNELHLFRKGETYQLVLKLYELGVSEQSIGSESDLIMKFEFGDTLILHPSSECTPQTFVPAGTTRSKFGTTHSEYEITFVLNDELKSKMSEQVILFLRLTAQSEKEFNVPIKTKKGEKIKGKLNCLK